MKLKTVSLVSSILWLGHSTTQLNAGGGATLELIEPLRCVCATPNPSTGKPTKMIPLENIKEFEELTKAAEKSNEKALADIAKAKAESDARTAAKKVSAKSALRGVTKFTKDPVTGELVETEG